MECVQKIQYEEKHRIFLLEDHNNHISFTLPKPRKTHMAKREENLICYTYECKTKQL